jgi:hypothetical protein
VAAGAQQEKEPSHTCRATLGTKYILTFSVILVDNNVGSMSARLILRMQIFTTAGYKNVTHATKKGAVKSYSRKVVSEGAL